MLGEENGDFDGDDFGLRLMSAIGNACKALLKMAAPRTSSASFLQALLLQPAHVETACYSMTIRFPWLSSLDIPPDRP